jgi:hypothetical protein
MYVRNTYKILDNNPEEKMTLVMPGHRWMILNISKRKRFESVK